MSSDSEICWGGKRFAFSSDAQRDWLRACVDRGFTVPTWPKEYGGAGLDAHQAKVLEEEMAAINARPPLVSFGVSMLGPALLHFGSDEQKAMYLPPIARGEIRWCQGYSEPNSGSDLASLATRAESDGDHYVINGQKIWTSYADKADWIFALVRTDTSTKHGGISFVLIDMDDPNITAKPITLISGKSPFCEVFFDGVRVPKAHCVGGENQGWTVAKALLAHERQSIGSSSLMISTDERSLSQRAVDELGLDNGVLADQMIRASIAEWEVDKAAFDALIDQAQLEYRSGGGSPTTASLLKYYGAELNKRKFELLMTVYGNDGLEWEAADGPMVCFPARGFAPKPTRSKAGHPRFSSTFFRSTCFGCRGPDMIVSEELQQLAETAHGFLKEHAGPKAYRTVRDKAPAEGFDLDLWRRMSELGWAGIALPESLGGYDMGPMAVVMIGELLGAHLASTPFVSTVFAAKALAASASEGSLWAARLGELAEGRGLYAVAIDERARHRGLEGLRTKAEASGGGYRLSGAKRSVLDVPAADSLLVVAEGQGGIVMVDVPKDAAGVSIATAVQLDSRRTSTVTFDNVMVDANRVIGADDAISAVVASALDAARLAVAAEMVGAAKAVFDMTIEYMRDRKQFGVPIGSFQALQHRAAHVHTELSIASAAVRKAATALPDDAPAAVAVAKSKAGRVAIHTANEAIQLHGGVGVTDEFDVGLYVKRIRTLDNLFGDHIFHADRYARMRGF